MRVKGDTNVVYMAGGGKKCSKCNYRDEKKFPFFHAASCMTCRDYVCM